MARTFRINVTAEDIAAGERGSMTHCPIALACRRQVGGVPEVMPDDVSFVDFDEKKVKLRAELPPEASQFVRDFDDGFTAGVKPFSFDLLLLDDSYDRP